MDTIATNEELQENSKDSVMLAKIAKSELRQTNQTNIVCEKCGEKPELFTTERGERVICTCPCGYVHDVDIVF